MQISMKCSIAVHCLIFIYEAREKARVTSTLLAQSTSCNPVVIRYTLSALKKAGLISVERGKGGARLEKDPEEITLYEIYSALEPEGLSSLIGIHSCAGSKCPIARNIRRVLAGSLSENRRIYKKHHGKDYFGFYDRNLSSGSRGARGIPQGKIL